MRLKRSLIVAVLVLLIIIVGTSTLYLWLVNKTNVFKPTNPIGQAIKSLSSNAQTPETKAATYPSKLDGTLVTSLDLANRHPLGVMIENHPDARPQFGLSAASVVYEAIAEGGITRFLALYGPNEANQVGPVRSARTYFVTWCEEFDCYYGHWGGNIDALEKIPADGVKDMDEFANPGSYFRQQRGNVASEHTGFSTTAKLYTLANSKKWSSPLRDDYSIYTFKDDPATPDTAKSQTVAIDFSTPQYKVDYTFDPLTNAYKRNLAGKSHVDANTNQQISVKNIILQYIDRKAVVTKINENGFSMPETGSGKAVFFQNGVKVEGTWTKTNRQKRTEFNDANGKLIDLYRGSTWVEIINPGSTVTDK